jgi:hypothetical protein
MDCIDDGICAPLYESCDCADCKDKVPECMGASDAGAPSDAGDPGDAGAPSDAGDGG